MVRTANKIRVGNLLLIALYELGESGDWSKNMLQLWMHLPRTQTTNERKSEIMSPELQGVVDQQYVREINLRLEKANQRIAELERELANFDQQDRLKTKEINVLVAENRSLIAEIASAKKQANTYHLERQELRKILLVEADWERGSLLDAAKKLAEARKPLRWASDAPTIPNRRYYVRLKSVPRAIDLTFTRNTQAGLITEGVPRSRWILCQFAGPIPEPEP